MKKILLMGRSGSGKTSMRSIIFSGYRVEDTRRLGMTIDVERSQLRFLGRIGLNLWDCGGQQSYMDGYINASSKHVFSSVGVLIYVFDMVSSDGWGRDVEYYRDCLAALREYSPQAQVFCLLHKMDKVPSSEREAVYEGKVEELKVKSGNDPNVTCFATSIWNESLYFAWSRVVRTLIPNIAVLEKHLSQFARICSAAEVVLFEKTTFLVIERSGGVEAGSGFVVGDYEPRDHKKSLHPQRFEKIIEMVKELKSACQKSGRDFQGIELQADTFSAYLDTFTPNTYILVVIADPSIELAAVRMNVLAAREQFVRLEAMNTT
ncbi:GTP-binding protein gtr1 [Tilletia horrida]|uniref:GTP-binding protein n=1 Tax=Tilletia horrida TaxID=155126 RepID=A0AAN6G6T2_9BASI|nr:GTP-binding protein gtr1 [Tilletia horrida]KAK0530958.1 GTP-binding protein gtr1 [Tilletia horrida]KAK0535250.1 GTP-binding protein gtr1 [Tilletia horrida]KAK0561603.1 GTP-binding protein gtr1 [Tilletia horrida]